MVIRVSIATRFEAVIGCTFLRGRVRKEGGAKNTPCNALIRMGKSVVPDSGRQSQKHVE